jgi:CelD/BcsL family acetyltransferase involved in cellulose biosynthesis
VTIEPLRDFADARALWEHLEGAVENPFATWMFAELWWRHLGGDRALHLTAVRVSGRPLALLPLCESADELRLIGYGDADLLGPVCAREHLPVALRALRDFALVRGKRLIADELPAGCATPLGGEVLRRTPSPVLDLPPDGFEASLEATSRNHRGAVRNRERRLARAYDVRVRTADEHTLAHDLETLFSLHHARWAGSTSVFSGPRAGMHRELARLALSRGWLRLRLLELDGRPVAANYALRVGDAEWYYQAGRDPSLARWSVGLVLQAACIRSACEEGAVEYRLLRGDQRYKQSWASRDEPLETVLVDAS